MNSMNIITIDCPVYAGFCARCITADKNTTCIKHSSVHSCITAASGHRLSSKIGCCRTVRIMSGTPGSSTISFDDTSGVSI